MPKLLEIHLAIDNSCTHKRATKPACRHPCNHVHYSPTYAFWLNQVKRWFGLILQQANPFVWVTTAESIPQKIERLCLLISKTRHYVHRRFA